MNEEQAYRDRRISFYAEFERKKIVEESKRVDRSPSGKYAIETMCYSSGPSTWDYSRGIVTEVDSGRIIADVKRNIGHFWHAWVTQGDGAEYLLCGEDYQGYLVVDLPAASICIEFPGSGYDGVGFCWAAVHPSPDGKVLAVEGCYWACPYELVFFDFSSPSVLPLPELFRADFHEVTEGWVGNDEFRYTVEDADYEDDPKPPILAAAWTRPI